jgi:hypothetical protein
VRAEFLLDSDVVFLNHALLSYSVAAYTEERDREALTEALTKLV